MQFTRFLLSGNIARVLQRRLVSTVNINVNSLASIEIKAKDLIEKSDDFVKLTFLDVNKKEVEASTVKSLQISSTTDDFKMDCIEPTQLSAVIEIPLGSSPESLISVVAGSSLVYVTDLQAKSINIKVDSGDLFFKNVKATTIKAETAKGNMEVKGSFVGQTIHMISKAGDVNMRKSQGGSLEVDAGSIYIGSSYHNKSKLTSSCNAFLKNVHGTTEIKASGDNFKLLGMTGEISADLDCEIVEIQFADLYGVSKITSNNPKAEISLGMSDDVIQGTQISLISSCSIDNFVDCFIVTHKKKIYEVSRQILGKSKGTLTFTAKKGKSVELKPMSWVDFFRSVNTKNII